MILSLATGLGLCTAAITQAAPPTPAYEFINGQWWNGKRFVPRTMYGSSDGLLYSHTVGRNDGVIDLHGGFVIPPLAEGHNHWLEPAQFDKYNECYLADGVYYVKDMANIPYLFDQIRDKVNLPTSVDLVSAMTPFTGPGAHPVEVVDQFVKFGILPKGWKPDYDGEAEYVVQTNRDIDVRFKALLKQNPAYVKAFLLFSDEYEQRLHDPKMYGNHRGMDPGLLPHLVELAHAAGLRVEVHIYSRADFRNAVLAGADEIAHLPGVGAQNEPQMSLERFRLTQDDAKLAAAHHVTVTTTLDWLLTDKTPFAKRLTKEVIVPNLKLLKRYRIPILVGSDHFRHSSLGEVFELRNLGVFTNAELLNAATDTTVHYIFPKRELGKLANGYEANFLVLSGNPVENIDNLKTITLRIKQGRPLTVPDWALHRPGLSCVAE